jgi:2,5-diketo-D-gluconate reductase A
VPAPFTKTVRGVEVPTVAIGVFEVDPGETEETVADALAAGYRHVDTAAAYGNEAEVGRALARERNFDPPFAPDWRD